jgi:hypothetical protein
VDDRDPDMPPPLGATQLALEPSAPPDGARCLGCGYALRGLAEARCPECGRRFDPDDVETVRLPTWSGFLARRALKRPGLVLYLWPFLAALLLYVAAQWKRGLVFSPYPDADIRIPNWTGIAYYRLDLGGVASLAWAWLLALLTVRAWARRHVVIRHRLPIDRLFRDRSARRFASACFLAAMLFGGYHTDLCSHGEYWEWWGCIGVVRDAPGRDWCEAHWASGLPLGGRWRIYCRSPRWSEH